MHLQKIQLYNFKNYQNTFLEFSDGLNCILGPNGSGKTNLLDAIYFLSLCKSSIHSQDNVNVRFEQEYFQIEGLFNDQILITCMVPKIGKKSFLENKVPYPKLTDHIGKYPLVLIGPDDTDLIRDNADTRRKLFDGIIAQLNKPYLEQLMKYNRVLEQRNKLLQRFAESQSFDGPLLDIYTDQMVELGLFIHQQRKDFLIEFMLPFLHNYELLSEGKETPSITYVSDFEKMDANELYKTNQTNDLAAQRTTKGIHKDDFVFELESTLVKKYGSQGQKKSFVMAIKLAQFEIMETKLGIKPMLLLDDIFDKLDENRIKKLLEMIKNARFGQVFLSDARPERTQVLLKGFKTNIISTI